VVRPDDGQPHPLALLNHGSPMIDVSIPDVPAPESLNSNGREAFKSYLERGPNKAFVVGGSHFGWTTGRRSADEAVEDALGRCRPDPGDQCRVVNINDKPAE
jgi:hypothetical protein